MIHPSQHLENKYDQNITKTKAIYELKEAYYDYFHALPTILIYFPRSRTFCLWSVMVIVMPLMH